MVGRLVIVGQFKAHLSMNEELGEAADTSDSI